MILRTLSEHYDLYCNSLDTLRAHNVKIDGTRLAAYKKHLSKAIAKEVNESSQHQNDHHFLNALLESSEIIKISEIEDRYLDNEHVVDKLQRIPGGPEIMSADGHDPSRDYAFEFSVAAELQSKGQLSGFAELHGDIRMMLNNTPVECKRISSFDSLKNRLKKAKNQLGAAIRSGSPPGIIALDFTRPIRINHRVIRANDEHDFLQQAQQRLISTLRPNLFKPRILEILETGEANGIVLRSLSVGNAGDSSNVRSATVWQAASLHAEKSSANVDFLKSAAYFGSGGFVEGTADDLAEAESAIRNQTVT